jgi:DNA phosphorothioation-dependent restriction protein DptH
VGQFWWPLTAVGRRSAHDTHRQPRAALDPLRAGPRADPRGLLGEVCAAFGLPEPGIGGAVIDGAFLATRVQRYLVQHPYISTLTINAFNPGRAGVLAQMLLALQRQPVFEDILYDVRLFVPDADAPGVGEGLAELLSPSGNLTGREADAFATPSGDHLHPKLALGVRSNEY